MTQQVCPERTVLAAFGRGELPEEAFELVAAHVADCPSCQQALAQLGDDSDALLAGLRLVRGREDQERPPDTRLTQHDNATASSTVQVPAGYELLGEVGRGGMGVVYRARDTRLNREVAIKLLQQHYPKHSAVCARFVAEAQITGQLQHPGIPAVHELGQLPDGRPFLAMKLVKGHTLQQLLHERGDPSQEWGRFLAIFEQICQAVGYAHAHRVIHRDLKPGNVMVGAFGEVQVMDWGLAKLLAENKKEEEKEGELPQTLLAVTAIQTPQQADSATRTGSVMGTPAYMAPEQAGGEVRKLDARSDVFGLGAILCEILTGLPPYQGKDVHAVRLQAVRGELADVLSRLEACGAEPEVVALCERCLAFKQEDRPADGGAVASAVASIRQAAEERARRAELARAEALVRVAEQRKRRRVWLGLAACLLLGLLASTGLGLWANHARQAESVAREAEQERAEGERLAKVEAMASKEQAQKRLKQIEKGNEILTSIFMDLNIGKIKQEKDPLEAVLAKRLVKAAEQLEGEAVGDALTVAVLQYHLGESLVSLGYPGKAIPLFQQVQKTRSLQLGPNDPQTLQSLAFLAEAYRQSGQTSKALPLLQETWQRIKARNGPDDLDTLASMSMLALCYQADGQLKKALPLHEEVYRRYRATLGYNNDRTLSSMNNLAMLYYAAGQLDKAVPLYEETLERKKAFLGPNHLDTLAGMNNLAVAYKHAGRLDKALPLLEETLRQYRTTLGVDHPDTLMGMNNLATSYEAAGQLDKAISLYTQTIPLKRKRLGPDHPDTLTSIGNLALAYCAAKRGQEAVSLFAEYFERQRLRTKPNDPGFAGQLANASQKLLTCERYKEAETYLRECLAIRTKTQPDAWNTFNSMSQLGGALWGQKRYAEAEPLLLKGYEGMKQREAKIPKAGKVRLSEAGTRLVQLYDAWGKPMEATKWRKELAQRTTPDAKPKK